jgi:mono/diheme cytochrome c family protein
MMDIAERGSSLTMAPVLWIVLMVASGAAAAGGGAPETGSQLYREACSACHGLDGRGVSHERLGFDTPVPDFTDCRFAVREADHDWLAVAHRGGPARGFSRRMPAFGAALDDHQIELVMAHVRTFCPDPSWPAGELNLPRPLFTEKAFPEDEFVYTLDLALGGPGKAANELLYEKRFGPRNQVELLVPFSWRESGLREDWKWGLGDVALAFKRAVVHSRKSGSIFSLTGEVILPTGDSVKGFGKGTTIFEPFAAFGQILPANTFFQAQAGLELPADTDLAGREAFWRLALGKTFVHDRFGRSWSPMVECLAARELESGAPVVWDVVPQMQVTLSTRQHIRFNLGFLLPLTEREGRDSRMVFYLLWDWFDGGLTDGW